MAVRGPVSTPPATSEGSWRPDAVRAITTGLPVVVLATALFVPPLGGLLKATGFWFVEVVGRLCE